MRIVLFSSSFQGGGITSYAKEFIAFFSQNNDCHIIIGDDSSSPIREDNVTVHYYESSNLGILNAKNVLHLINAVVRPDVVVGSNSALLSLIAPYIDDNIRVILVSHSLKYFEADMAARPHRFIDGIVALSEYNKKYLVDRFHINDHEKISVIYNFVHDRIDAERIRNNKKGNDEIIIVNPGGAHPSKNPALIVSVIRGLCKTDLPFKFYWLGSTHILQSEKFFFSRYHDVSQLLPDDKRVVLTGKISRDEAEEIIARCNVFFFPSIREGCSVSLLEAMRIGAISIVSNDDNANKEIIKDGINGFVVPRDEPERYIEILEKVISSHSLFDSFYDNSYGTFVSLLSKHVWENKMKHLIEGNRNHHRRKSFSKPDYVLRRLSFKFSLLVSKFRIILEENIKTIIQLNKL